jgi:hypothetical protein
MADGDGTDRWGSFGAADCDCCGCVEFSDDFNRDDADDPGDDWNVI